MEGELSRLCQPGIPERPQPMLSLISLWGIWTHASKAEGIGLRSGLVSCDCAESSAGKTRGLSGTVRAAGGDARRTAGRMPALR